MTREDLLKEVLDLKGQNWVLQLPTGTGKSRIALEKVKSLKCRTLLIVINRIVHKKNWVDEIHKWWPNCNLTVTFVTYASFPKAADSYDCVIFDEAHHLSYRCRDALHDFNIKYSILCSATISNEMRDSIIENFDNPIFYEKSLRDIIDESILPDPRIILMPLQLGNLYPTEYIIKNKSAKGSPIKCSFVNRWPYLKQKNRPVIIECTPRQYYYDLSQQIEWLKKMAIGYRREAFKNRWLQFCGERLKWLSRQKEKTVLKILEALKDKRILTLCSDIDQTSTLGEHCINSKNVESFKILDDFNAGRVNHITACNMLNEGLNLVNCQIGIYVNLNSSRAIVVQRLGRLLRHPNPIIIIPYFENTREQELVEEMLKLCNPNLITTIKNVNELKI